MILKQLVLITFFYIYTYHHTINTFIEALNNDVDENVKDTSKDFILVTTDAKSLYNNIPNHEHIEAVKETLNNQAKEPTATRVIIKFLYFILTLNKLVFKGTLMQI